MKKRLGFILICLAAVLLFSLYLTAQVHDPGVPRAWWNAVRNYIDGKSSLHTMTFIHYGTPSDRILAIFTPSKALKVDRIDVFAHAPVDSDSTALEIANGKAMASCLLDSGRAACTWFSGPGPEFAAALPCTVRFGDDRYSGAFISGADTPSVVIQYHVSP